MRRLLQREVRYRLQTVRVRFDTSSKGIRTVPSQARQKRIQQATCRNCNLVTPAWRELCLHCGYPLPSVGAKEHRMEEIGRGNLQGDSSPAMGK